MHLMRGIGHIIKSKRQASAGGNEMKLKKAVYITIGCIGLALGTLGAVLPLLPAFPFLMLAALCFGKSSERLHSWFIGTKLYKNNLEAFVKGEGMTWSTKLRTMLIVTAIMAFGYLMMSRVPVGRIILCVVWALHILYFAFGIKTAPSKRKQQPTEQH